MLSNCQCRSVLLIREGKLCLQSVQVGLFRFFFSRLSYLFFLPGASVVQWVKRWPADLAVPSFEPRSRRSLLKRKRGSTAHSLSLSSAHRPDITKILWKGRKNASYPYILSSSFWETTRYRLNYCLRDPFNPKQPTG